LRKQEAVMKNRGTTEQYPQQLAAAGILFLGLLAGCGDPQSTFAPKPPAGSSVPAEASTSLAEFAPTSGDMGSAEENPDFGGVVKQGMSYIELRKSLESHGWNPVIESQCRANVVGANHEKLCAEHPENESCGYCDQMPGLSSCSSDGDCSFVFRHSAEGRVLEVGMGGELEQWKSISPEVMFGVTGWRYSAK
jgi:hypothetical protein